MLWRVRATLPDRPGALAALAAECGASAVNILGFQIFPGVALVTDELVLDTPEGWQPADVQALVERSHGEAVSVVPCTEAALADQPTRYVQAAAAVLASPASFPDVLARLFDAEAEPPTGDGTLDVLEVTVASVLVQVRRGGAVHRHRAHPGRGARVVGGRRADPGCAPRAVDGGPDRHG